jgi:hypothetical protein
MSNYANPIYETHFTVTGDALDDVDIWIDEVVQNSLQQDGIVSARVFSHESGEDGHAVRSCQFQARDDNALDELLDGFFADVDADAAARFGESLSVDSRTLRADHSNELPANESPVCLNCGTRLRGQYCGSCGQRARNRLISIWQLLREAFGDLLELDSRLWRTLLPLLIRPGRLTRDYLEGRRARYMPPFRTYLVLSVIFFVVAFFDPQDDLSLFFDPEPEPTAEEIEELAEKAASATAEAEKIRSSALEKLEALEAEGKISEDVVEDFTEQDGNFSISFNEDDSQSGMFGDCENATISDEEDMPEWVKKRFSDVRIKQICERNKLRGNDNFVDAMIDNVPIALIVLLPIMAMVLKVLYPLSRRYFVEHLLFFVHFHAFFFLILILQILFARLAGLLGPPDGAVDSISTLILVATSFYIPVYLYKAMRHVYGQGHIITIPKYFILSIAYLTGAAITMLGAFLVALLSA